MHFTTSKRRLSVLIIGLLLVLYPAVDAAAQAQDGLTPYQVAEIQAVTSSLISPGGESVIYTLSVPADPREENVPASSELHVLDVDTQQSRELYTDTSVSQLAFRPEHNTVTFLAERHDDDGRVLYEMDLDAEEPNRIFEFEQSIISYNWDPEGERIAFTANEDLDRPEPELPYEPTFFEENLPHQRGYIAHVDGNEEPIQIDREGTIYITEWSPQGDRLAISEAPTPHIDDWYMYQSVQVVDAETGEVTADIENEGKLDDVVWSPDGERLALLAADNIHDPIDGRIMVVSADGGTPENIYPEFEGQFEDIEWTDDNTIHFIASEGVESSFGTIAPDGTAFTHIIEPGGPILTGYSSSDDGQVAFTAQTPQHPGEVYLFHQDDAQPARATTTNEWLADVELGTQDVVTYTARDGAFDIEGLLIYPVDYEEGSPVPVITMVHGGPEAHYSNGWLTGYNLPGQMGAARGYAVFYPNYRGSTGRGLEFIKSSQGDAGGAEFDDIVDGIDYLIDQGIADENQIGVTGGSYGGYATAWMSTYYSDRFAAGVMNVGISNNISKWGTSDIPEELYLVHSREWLWENDNWQKYLERSPIYHVDNAETPLLIAHGAEDTRVHPGQSLELYRHMVVRQPDTPVRLILYPGEGHGYSRASARLDYNKRLLQWFDTYLQDEEAEMPDTHLELEPVEEPADH